jgi:hypothetical protein
MLAITDRHISGYHLVELGTANALCSTPQMWDTHSIFSVVGIAKEESHHYGKGGELLINYEETEQARRASSVGEKGGASRKSVEGVSRSARFVDERRRMSDLYLRTT